MGVLCELVEHATGEMMRLPECAAFAREHGLVLVAIKDLCKALQLQQGQGQGQGQGDGKGPQAGSSSSRSPGMPSS